MINEDKRYFNRELSLLEFNYRVLQEAKDKNIPLLERLKFICILSSNLDEFFMIRIAGLKSQVSLNISELSSDGLTAQKQLKLIRSKLLEIYKIQENILNNEILKNLEKENIIIHRFPDLIDSEKKNLKKYFTENILPVLTPMLLDSAHPFPRLIDRSLNIAFMLEDTDANEQEKILAFLQLPNLFPRFIQLDNREGNHYILIESLIKEHAHFLFPELNIITSNTFRVTRDADFEIVDDEAEDLIKEIQEQLKQRKWGRAAVRLEVSGNMPHYMVELLKSYLDLSSSDVYVHERPLKLSDFMELTILDFPNIKDKPFNTKTPPELRTDDIFDAISSSDIFLHHPFDSFTNTIGKFLNTAADDPDVMAIKITLYRTGSKSMVIDALKKAAENGKDVVAFVELKARFDEENNIIWARELENAGVHVVYGVLGLKTHSKIAMIVRRESGELKTYIHLSTGNYNHFTSRVYTDFAIMTADKSFAEDGVNLFNYLTGISKYKKWKSLTVAPVGLHEKILYLIERETKNHSKENPGLIIAKMNQLTEKKVIEALYHASQKGVEIKLLVRGICSIRPGVEGLSENIQVKSIIGRFLEHSRAFYFRNSGEEEVYISSADWMTRNFQRRVELLIPINSNKIKVNILNILNQYWGDNQNCWHLLPGGTYEKLIPRENVNLVKTQENLLAKSN
jgi:polyphosphate kinase